ncbi:hypothetical protein RZS08_00405, partial [Arthrospira platensis SPKY1]|nr:hypothetical protein [Arthrospira platensis SPKY1]
EPRSRAAGRVDPRAGDRAGEMALVNLQGGRPLVGQQIRRARPEGAARQGERNGEEEENARWRGPARGVSRTWHGILPDSGSGAGARRCRNRWGFPARRKSA